MVIADLIHLKLSGVVTGDGAGLWHDVSRFKAAEVTVSITAVTAVTAFDAYLEVTPDGGTTVYEMPVDLALQFSGAAGGNTVGRTGATS
jgi:hypothetical protein